jgi:hypothetical protein
MVYVIVPAASETAESVTLTAALLWAASRVLEGHSIRIHTPDEGVVEFLEEDEE